MTTSVQIPLSTAPRRSRIRALVADSDDQRRCALLNALFRSGLYDVLGEAATADECREVVHTEFPELVVCSDKVLPRELIGEQTFPLFVVIGSRENAPSSIFGCVEGAGDSLDDMLAAAASKIVTLKASELLVLMGQYLQHNDQVPSYVRSITVEHAGKAVSLPTSQIRWIKASGNYVSLYTDTGVYGMRESIRRTFATLQKSGFVRIHRGAIVNEAAIRRRVLDNGTTVAVELGDGTVLRVGPRFRSGVPTGDTGSAS